MCVCVRSRDRSVCVCERDSPALFPADLLPVLEF